MQNAFADNSIINIGLYELAPHMIVEKERTQGTMIDYIENEIKPQIEKNQKIVYLTMPFTRLMTELKEGRVDVVFLITKSSEREMFADYAPQSIFNTNSVLIFNKDRSIGELKEKKQLANLTIGHTLGSVVPKFIKESGAKIDWITGDDALERDLEKLKNKRVDAVFAPTFSHAEYIIHKKNFDQLFDLRVVPETKLKLYFAFRKGLSSEVKSYFLKNSDPEKTYLNYIKAKKISSHR